MILVTGASGFVGSALVAYLSERGLPVRALLRPSRYSPQLPRNIPVEVAVSSMQDERGIRAALKDVTCIFHLASSEKEGQQVDLEASDVKGLENLLQAAEQVGVERIIFLSHIGADRTSGFPAFRAKAIAEKMIQNSQTTATILRTAVIFGQGDGFISYFARGLAASKLLYSIPGRGDVLMQPLWINDLINCLFLAYQNEEYAGKIFLLGGGEYFTFRAVLQMIMEGIGKKRFLVPIAPAMLRARNLWFGESPRASTLSTFWIDYLASDRTCSLDSLPHQFNILPGRFSEKLERYLPAFPSR
ncbi:MAG: NAD-dependent epimerase/dehydratase family protein [Anaerolineaceae bacterium]|jgi:NADH dehydrogenase|nr:MAG: NAD-dependent epimerase/dehydratase family protein [Anaerolineaceae bacterium]